MRRASSSFKKSLPLIFLLALCSSHSRAGEPSAASMTAAKTAVQKVTSKVFSIQVKMSGFPDDQGVAIVALHFDKDSFPKAERAAMTRRVKIHKGLALASFDNIAPGTYAVTVVHDRNQDGVLGFSWWPYPHTTEYAGSSLNQPSRIGPPVYDKAKFIVSDHDVTLVIRMQI